MFYGKKNGGKVEQSQPEKKPENLFPREIQDMINEKAKVLEKEMSLFKSRSEKTRKVNNDMERLEVEVNRARKQRDSGL